MRPLFLFLAAAVIVAAPARAIDAVVEAVCQQTGVHVTVVIPTDDLPPENWVGYIVTRNSHGVCLDEHLLTPAPIPFSQDATFLDIPPIADLTYTYRAWGLDDQGGRHVMGILDTEMAGVTCGSAPMVRGRLVDWGWTLSIEPCADMCWLPGFISNPVPEWVLPYVGTDQVFDFRGAMAFNFEGPYFDVTDIEFSACDAVPARQRSWSEVKSLYGE